ncbi:hypothetical protein [Embleya sp. NPDC005971]|uniref:hypothetical protein n=1 Tax=Embleya sp. NPDC005971 TaxID=3156724 RepID=UPI0033DE13E3
MSVLSYLRGLAEEAAVAADSLRDDAVTEARERADFIGRADEHATTRLGFQATGNLTWEYDEYTTDGVEGADAWLGERTRLRYEYDHDTEKTTFRLIRECVCCGGTTVVHVGSLADLAGHLQDECWTDAREGT